MARGNFKVSVSTVSGGSAANILRIFRGNEIEPSYYPRAITSLAFSLIAEPFRLWEHVKYDSAVKGTEVKQPVFILGHWRSGTTHLHNLMCQDPRIGYVTTYQGVFPELLGSGWLFKTFMKAVMPEKRASDNVALSADFPQEEEFALGNMNPYGFYNFWFFPKRTREYYERHVEFRGMNEKEISRWKSDYIRLIKKALIYTKRSAFISKNPPNTARIRMLLEMFPDAKFIHIYRNPVTVFVSTRKLIQSTMPAIQFQDISGKEIENNILWIYDRMMRTYLRDRSLIPKENLVEVRFEDFEKAALSELEKIYAMLRMPGFQTSKNAFDSYIQSQKSYAKNKYGMPEETVKKILKQWKFAMDEWNYSIPDNVEIIDEIPALS